MPPGTLNHLLPRILAQSNAIKLTTDPDNIASQRTMLANGAVLVAHFTKPAAFGGKAGLRYRIGLTGG